MANLMSTPEAKAVIQNNIHHIADGLDVETHEITSADMLDWYESELDAQDVDTQALTLDDAVIRRHFHYLGNDDKDVLDTALLDYQRSY